MNETHDKRTETHACNLISRQAAIDALNVSLIFGRCNGKIATLKALKKYAEGVRERIDALPSAQSEEPSHDAVMDYCRKRCISLVDNELLRKMPAAQKTGKWEKHFIRPNVFADLYFHCSVCGGKTDVPQADIYFKYCPYCGARMEGVE